MLLIIIGVLILRQYYQDDIFITRRNELAENCVFVFGSNESGIHGAGAALIAKQQFGAKQGRSYGHYGDSFAIPTKDTNIRYALPLTDINRYVQDFIKYANKRTDLQFFVTKIGCGLAGLDEEKIAPMFASLENGILPESWSRFYA